jgi:hypothetical protein
LIIFAGTLSLLIVGCHSDRAANVNLDPLQKRLRAGEIPNLHSVVIIRHDRVMADWYFEGTDEERGRPLGTVTFGPETLHDVRSVTTSIVSLLVGIAMADHAIESLVHNPSPGHRQRIDCAVCFVACAAVVSRGENPLKVAIRRAGALGFAGVVDMCRAAATVRVLVLMSAKDRHCVENHLPLSATTGSTHIAVRVGK